MKKKKLEPKTMEECGINITTLSSRLLVNDKDINEYEIDHIKEIDKFDYNNDEDIRNCWNVNNLQWLTKEEHRDKTAHYNMIRNKNAE